MTFYTTRQPGASSEVRLHLTGAFDAEAVAAARSSFETIAASPVRRVELDLSGVSSIDGSGIGAIAYLFKRLVATGRTLAVTGVSGEPRALLESLGLSRILGLEPRPSRRGRPWFGGLAALGGH